MRGLDACPVGTGRASTLAPVRNRTFQDTMRQITASVGHRMQVYGFLQVPVYSNLQGYQLFPRWTVTVGLSGAL